MKYLITTIAAVVLVGCGPSVDIHQACKDGNIEAVKQYLAAGWDVNTRDKAGLTPLLLAASFGNDDIAKLLISSGAKVSAKSNFGTTPLHYCGKEIAELLIAKGADVNAKCEIKNTPLYSAIYEGRRELAELLIAKGADVNATNYNVTPLETPLDIAIKMGREISGLLRNNGGKTGDEFREIAALLRKHGGKTGEELEAEGK